MFFFYDKYIRPAVLSLFVLIAVVASFGQVFYSTPEQYTQAKHDSQLEWSVKKDDFFPYADCPVRERPALQQY